MHAENPGPLNTPESQAAEVSELPGEAPPKPVYAHLVLRIVCWTPSIGKRGSRFNKFIIIYEGEFSLFMSCYLEIGNIIILRSSVLAFVSCPRV